MCTINAQHLCYLDYTGIIDTLGSHAISMETRVFYFLDNTIQGPIFRYVLEMLTNSLHAFMNQILSVA